jgi:hypothetical protein
MAVGPMKNTEQGSRERKFWFGECEALYFDGENRKKSGFEDPQIFFPPSSVTHDFPPSLHILSLLDHSRVNYALISLVHLNNI